jgi:hypothetical protein
LTKKCPALILLLITALNLELHSGKTVWTPVCIKKPDARDGNLSLADLSDMD